MSYFTQEEIRALAATQTTRCLGCAAVVGERGVPHAYETSDCWGETRTATCPGRYQVGERVDYDRWLEMLRRFCDAEPFNSWADGSPRLGLPSWFSSTELVALLAAEVAR